ncbi:glycosyltransferase family 59 protein [Hypoxylon trugodes]|uniref:glycosyltransferase family 59 protein n=1 Tax=Hypoxylon trugodes TaxID=326681 RepID=UPI00219F2637|nr:glycosyltransferase family 59 protein [Hypoxylon trugodes]KAI1382652.1 glycosyltransferase family 59 protein [Hypoxylon trugodes]
MASWRELDSSLIIQTARYLLVFTIFHIYTIRKEVPLRIKSAISTSLVAIALLSRQWLSVVTKHVPEPYLDEVFHIPQAQVYCEGKYFQWDDKITTPPGLYALTILANKLTGIPCEAYHLRYFNAEIISYLALAAIISRARLEQPETPNSRRYSPYAIWTGINVALFPVLFFFSGLYYTDVISTLVVLLAYTNHQSRVGPNKPSLLNDVYSISLGLLTLCMRQTNIFWVVVYMGGLEAVHSIKTLRPKPVATPKFTTLSQQIKFDVWRYSLGDIHDPALNLTNPIDILLCVISIGISAICNLGTILRHIWSHLVVLGAFVGFVAWNGGVVLGDKSNHVATLHLAQMLYIWPLFAFFSVPLFVPPLLNLVANIFNGLIGSTPTSSRKTPVSSKDANKSNQSAALKAFNYLGSSHITHSVIILAGALAIATLIVRFNTIIHPFTLADNRHFMFYVFRYTILKAWWVRYALVPVYVACGWLCWTTLRGNPTTALGSSRWIRTPFGNENRVLNQSRSEKKRPNRAQEVQDVTAIPPATTSVLILLLASALSLITAPLVEPRYFIIPWVFWRLLVPSQLLNLSTFGLGPKSLVSQRLVLVLETTWFLLINAATMYIFITRPFYWRAPDGTLLDDGKVQRFMW